MVHGQSTLADKKLILVQEDDRSKESALLVKEVSRYNWQLFQVTSKLILPDGLKPAGALMRNGLDHQLVKRVIEKGIPLVRVGNFPEYYARGMNSVSVDLAECGRVAARYFADRGFKSIAFIGNEPWGASEDMYERLKKCSDALGCQCHLFQLRASSMAPQDMGPEEWGSMENERMVEWMKTLPKPIGLLAYSDKFASRMTLSFRSAGMRVPDDIAILGIGNHEFRCETSLVPLSSIEHAWEDVWRESFKMLNCLIEGEPLSSDTIRVPPKRIVERASTEILPVSDPEVALALKYLWENFYKDISTSDLVSIVSISRSALERRFKQSLGRTINDELRRKRVEVAERLLCNTDQTVSEIAKQVGFNSRNHFYKVFETAYQCTPAKYRSAKRGQTK
jgi:LacI family transcriptional regulator